MGGESVKIRDMVIDDLAGVVRMGEKLFTLKDFPNLYRTWDEYGVVNLFQAEPEFSLVAYVGEKLAGFALGYVIEKPRRPWNYGHLVWLGVDKPYQGLGVATKLLDCFRERMEKKGVRIMLVDTQADNKVAINFFKKHGFANPRKHVYMTLNLDEPSKE